MVGWTTFVVAAVLTWLVYLQGWMIGPYYLLLSVLGLLNVGLGIWVVLMHGVGWRSVLLVIAGLLVGQWWFVQSVLVQGIWSIRGFAP